MVLLAADTKSDIILLTDLHADAIDGLDDLRG